MADPTRVVNHPEAPDVLRPPPVTDECLRGPSLAELLGLMHLFEMAIVFRSQRAHARAEAVRYMRRHEERMANGWMQGEG